GERSARREQLGDTRGLPLPRRRRGASAHSTASPPGPQSGREPVWKERQGPDHEYAEDQLDVVGQRSQQLWYDAQHAAPDQAAPDRTHAADDRVGEGEYRRQHAIAVGINDAKARRQNSSCERDQRRAEREGRDEVVAYVDAERTCG